MIGKLETNSTVVDTSVLVPYFSNEEYSNLAYKLFKLISQSNSKVILPELAKYELLDVLTIKKGYKKDELSEYLSFFNEFPAIYDNLEYKDMPKINTIALDLKIRTYDAVFIYTAKKYNTFLITNDKHQKTYKGTKVVQLKNFKM